MTARQWLKCMALPELDSFEMDLALDQGELLDRQLERTELRIAERLAQQSSIS